MNEKITGPICPSCGRDNTGYDNICTSDDCPGVKGSDLELWRLTLSILIAPHGEPGACTEARIADIVHNAINNAVVTGDGAAEVADYSYTIHHLPPGATT